MKLDELKVVSPFEYAIRQAANCAEGYRAETESEKIKRLNEKAIDFALKIKIKSKS